MSIICFTFGFVDLSLSRARPFVNGAMNELLPACQRWHWVHLALSLLALGSLHVFLSSPSSCSRFGGWCRPSPVCRGYEAVRPKEVSALLHSRRTHGGQLAKLLVGDLNEAWIWCIGCLLMTSI